MIKAISKSKFAVRIQYVIQIMFIIVLILFIDSLQRSFKTQEKHDNQEHGHKHDSFLHAKLFQAQRNMYLTGSVLFLSLVLNRFFAMILDLATNEAKTEVLKQQAAKTTKEYLVLMC